jgi:phosphoglycerate dehydrogenase-like enzyme
MSEAKPPRVAILDDYEHALQRSPHLTALAERVELVAHDRRLDDDKLETALAGTPIVIAIRERTRFPAHVLARMRDVELLLQTGGHAYHVDVEAASREGILVALGRGSKAPTPVVAELVMGLMIAWYRNLIPAAQGMRDGLWPASLGRVLGGRTLGILGLGRHGVTVARLARAFGMAVLVWGPTLTHERAAAAGATYLPLDEVLARSDVVSIHLRLSPESTGLIGAGELELMGPATLLVNTSRGPIVDEGALVDALRAGKIEGAALDVFDVEPLPADHPLRTLDNVICTPHIGYTVDAAFDDFAETSATQLRAYLDGVLDPGLVLKFVAVVGTLGAWAIIVPSKFTEGKLEDQVPMRLTLLALGTKKSPLGTIPTGPQSRRTGNGPSL